MRSRVRYRAAFHRAALVADFSRTAERRVDRFFNRVDCIGDIVLPFRYAAEIGGIAQKYRQGIVSFDRFFACARLRLTNFVFDKRAFFLDI